MVSATCVWQPAPGCSAGISLQRTLALEITQLGAQQRLEPGMGFCARLQSRTRFSERGNQEGTEVTCCFTQTASRLYASRSRALVYVCCDSLVPNPAGSQLRALEKPVLLRRATLE